MNNNLTLEKISHDHVYKQIVTMGFMITTLILSLSGCQNFRSPPPIVNVDIPNIYDNPIQGRSIASQGYQKFFADPQFSASD